MSAAEQRRRAKRLGRFGSGRAENLLGGEAGARRGGPSRRDLILAAGDEFADEIDLEQFTIKVHDRALTIAAPCGLLCIVCLCFLRLCADT